MYSRQNRNPREDVSVELPRDYSGSAFYPFPMHQEVPHRPPAQNEHGEEKKKECPAKDCEIAEKEHCCDEHEECSSCEKCITPHSEPNRPNGILPGLSGLLGGNIGLEELLLLGVIFLIFSDDGLRDNELLICLLLILFI